MILGAVCLDVAPQPHLIFLNNLFYFVRQEKLRVGVLAIKYHELAEPLDAPPLRLGVCLGQQAMEMHASLLEARELFELAGRFIHERQASRRCTCEPTQYSLFRDS